MAILDKLVIEIDSSSSQKLLDQVKRLNLELLHQVQKRGTLQPTLAQIAFLNRSRCNHWHPNGLHDWSPLEWAGAMCGEAGEAANVAKKIKRLETATKSANNFETLEAAKLKLMEEIGGTFIYLDLLAQRCELDLAECIVYEFNRVSEREGFEERL